MVIFPCSKINLGLNIVNKRPDGYHNIQSIMAQIGWSDVLEVVASQTDQITLHLSGRRVDCPTENNLVMKAVRKVEEVIDHPLPGMDIYLRKIVPDGAGLGGGSADAAAMVRIIDSLFALGLTPKEQSAICASLGADCPLFLHKDTMIATGTGTDLRPVTIPALSGMNIIVAKPPVSVSTAEAYAGVIPTMQEWDMDTLAALPPKDWREALPNIFESSVFACCPQIATIKDYFYRCGAVYASMSGSGAAVYGLFDGDILADTNDKTLERAIVWTGRMK